MGFMGWNRVQCSRDTVGSCGALHESQCIQWGLECFHIWKRWLHSSYMADNLWQGPQPLGMVHMECLVQGRRQDPWGIALWQSPEYRSKYTPWNWGNEFTIESIHSRVNWRNCTDTMIFCSTLTLLQAKYTVYDWRVKQYMIQPSSGLNSLPLPYKSLVACNSKSQFHPFSSGFHSRKGW